MIYKKLVVFILILISIFSLANYEMLFYKRQKLLILESNSLLSPRNVLANESIKHSWRSDQKPKDKFTIYGIIERSSNQTVIGFYTTDYTKINLPIKNGSFFSIEDSKEAIVGKDIPIYYKNDVAYFDYGNIPYKVVGELGISKESPLRKYVLINDLKLLERDYVPLIFDGSDLNKIEWIFGTPIEKKGVERWLDMTFFLKWIRHTTLIVIICSSIFAAYFCFSVTNQTRKTRFLIGQSIVQIFIRELTILSILAFVVALLSWFFIVNDLSFFFFEHLIIYFVIYISLISTWMYLTINQIARRY